MVCCCKTPRGAEIKITFSCLILDPTLGYLIYRFTGAKCFRTDTIYFTDGSSTLTSIELPVESAFRWSYGHPLNVGDSFRFAGNSAGYQTSHSWYFDFNNVSVSVPFDDYKNFVLPTVLGTSDYWNSSPEFHVDYKYQGV